MDPSKLGFSSYNDQFTKKAPNNQFDNKKRNNHHEFQQDFCYRQSDFPAYDSNYSESGCYKHNDQSQSSSNLPDQQSFLDLCKLVKSMQDSQSKFQTRFETEIQSLKSMHSMTPVPQFPIFNQLQNPSSQQYLQSSQHQ